MPYALIYHDVAAEHEREAVGFPGAVAARYKLAPDRFEAHLDAIAATGADVAPRLDASAGAVALTFDDGGASALAAADALECRGWRGHFFVTTGRIDTRGFLSRAGVLELSARGHAVGGHSHTHPTYIGRLGPAEIEREWRECRTILGDILGEAPLAASVPGGFFTEAVASTAHRAGYSVLMTSQPSARVRMVGGLTVLGRYTIWGSTPAATAAAYATGRRLPRARLWVEWNAKQRAKRLSPRAFERARALRARIG